MSMNVAVLRIDERRSAKSVTWKAWDDGVLVANVRQDRSGQTVDVTPLTEAVAKHFGVSVEAVEYRKGPKHNTARCVPSQAWVTLPTKQPEPQTCGHVAGEPACELAGCDGVPPVTIPLGGRELLMERSDRRLSTWATAGLELMDRVARRTGLAVADGAVGDNDRADRPGTREVDGLDFTVDGFPVRVLAYKSRPSKLQRREKYTAVYVDQTCVMQDCDAKPWRIVETVVEAVERLHDERARAKPTSNGWWLLKNPPVGFNVDSYEGLAEVVEPSTNNGETLRVMDECGKYRYIDRQPTERWPAAYGGAALDGHDTWGRYQRRTEFFNFVLAYRHGKYGHEGEATECDSCPGEVAGAQDPMTGHWPGRYVEWPWCARCGALLDSSVGRCPGAPPSPGQVAASASQDDASAVSPAPASVCEEPTPVGRVHVRSSSPVCVDLGGGRGGLANPCWCGRIVLPEGDKAWHVYGLKEQTVTCPVCFHLFTCPWAQMDVPADYCPVCAHIYSCKDKGCNPVDHPGIVPEPDPRFDRSVAVDAVVTRVEEAIGSGDLDSADKLIEAGDKYHPSHVIPGHDGWDGLGGRVWRLRKQRESAGQPGKDGSAATEPDTITQPTDVTADEPDVPRTSPQVSPAPELTVTTATGQDENAIPAAAPVPGAMEPDDETGAAWARALGL